MWFVDGLRIVAGAIYDTQLKYFCFVRLDDVEVGELNDMITKREVFFWLYGAVRLTVWEIDYL